MAKTDMQHLSVRCPIDLIEKLDQDAAAERRPRGFIVLEILTNHYATNGKPKKSAAKKKAGAR
jgi:hypothetical protein